MKNFKQKVYFLVTTEENYLKQKKVMLFLVQNKQLIPFEEHWTKNVSEWKEEYEKTYFDVQLNCKFEEIDFVDILKL